MPIHSRTQRDRESGIVSTSTEVVCGMTSLSRQEADAQKLLELNVAIGASRTSGLGSATRRSDQYRIRTNHGPQQLATARNAALALCRAKNYR